MREIVEKIETVNKIFEKLINWPKINFPVDGVLFGKVTPPSTSISKPKQEQSLQEQQNSLQEQHERELEEFRKSLTELSNIPSMDARRDAVIEAAQAHFFKALGSENWRLRADIIGTLNVSIGAHLAVTYVENWKTFHEAIKRQKP